MMDQKSILELVETEVRTEATSYAVQVYSELSKQIAAQIEDKVTEFVQASGGELEREARDIIQPAFMQYVCRELASQLDKAGSGWSAIRWANVTERYNETGEV